MNPAFSRNPFCRIRSNRRDTLELPGYPTFVFQPAHPRVNAKDVFSLAQLISFCATSERKTTYQNSYNENNKSQPEGTVNSFLVGWLFCFAVVSLSWLPLLQRHSGYLRYYKDTSCCGSLCKQWDFYWTLLFIWRSSSSETCQNWELSENYGPHIMSAELCSCSDESVVGFKVKTPSATAHRN